MVTDFLNLPAISMWFLLNPPNKATIEVQSIENFEWLSSKYSSTVKPQNSDNPRFSSALNHLRFYLPDIFPQLNKIVFLDHDVVVQRDLSELWSLDTNGKVNAAVETCQENEASFHRMDMFVNFSDPFVKKRFDVRACTWAFGMNLFNLKQWRRRSLTARYLNYLQAVCWNFLSVLNFLVNVKNLFLSGIRLSVCLLNHKLLQKKKQAGSI